MLIALFLDKDEYNRTRFLWRIFTTGTESMNETWNRQRSCVFYRGFDSDKKWAFGAMFVRGACVCLSVCPGGCGSRFGWKRLYCTNFWYWKQLMECWAVGGGGGTYGVWRHSEKKLIYSKDTLIHDFRGISLIHVSNASVCFHRFSISTNNHMRIFINILYMHYSYSFLIGYFYYCSNNY